MRRIFPVVASAALFALLSLSCGKKGDILPPLVRIPQKPEDVQAVQRGNAILLSWRNPAAYLDGSPLKGVEKVEVWVLEKEKSGEGADAGSEEMEREGRLAVLIPEEEMADHYLREDREKARMQITIPLPDSIPTDKQVVIAVRVKAEKRYSGFSDQVVVEPVVLPLPPREVKATLFEDRIALAWNPPLSNTDGSSPPNFQGYNVYRREGSAGERRLNRELVKEEKFADREFLFGRAYSYVVRAAATAAAPYLESDDSPPVEIFAGDTFPPSPPQGLVSVGGMEVIAISWEANPEQDVAGYRVWRRKQGGGEFVLLTPDLLVETAYSDRSAEKGILYEYAVTAVDKAGNESRRSGSVSEKIKGSIP